MKAIFLSIGSRGDIEPFLAIAQVLKEKDWEIACVFPEQFREDVEQESYQFYGFDKRFIEVLIKSTEGNLIMGGEGSIFSRIRAIYSLGKEAMKLNKGMIQLQYDAIQKTAPDLVFYHQKCLFPFIWSLQNPKKSILVNVFPCMIHPVASHSVIGLKGGGNYGSFFNKMSYRITNLIKSIAIFQTTKKFHREFPNTKISIRQIYRFALQKQRTFYTISPTLFSKPTNWHNEVKVVGYHERTKTNHWLPSPALLNFMEKNRQIVFISFGSISNSNPKKNTEIILNVLKKHSISAIIGTSWGGLRQPENCPKNVFFVNKIPHDWLFPRVAAVIHHGGSGTTHTGLKYGCPTLIIPHFIDQFFWNKKVAAIGAGPLGIAIKNLTETDFERLILDLLKNETYRTKAKWIAEKMAIESSKVDLYKNIENWSENYL